MNLVKLLKKQAISPNFTQFLICQIFTRYADETGTVINRIEPREYPCKTKVETYEFTWNDAYLPDDPDDIDWQAVAYFHCYTRLIHISGGIKQNTVRS